MKRILLSILAIFFPWIVILLEGKFIPAMACLALQLTFVGWIPASIWAFKAARRVEIQESTMDTTESSPETQVEMTDSDENKQPQQTEPVPAIKKPVETTVTKPKRNASKTEGQAPAAKPDAEPPEDNK